MMMMGFKRLCLKHKFDIKCACKMLFGLNFISLYTHVQNDNVINTNEQVSDIQNGIQKEVLGLM